jgi:predicted lipoprotein with Yx(FWY)xxD motif
MIRKSIALLLGTLAVAVVPLVSSAGADAATVELRNTSFGEILTDANGMTLFVFSSDPKGMDVCMTITHCTSVWPPLTVEGPITAAPGINQKKLGTITLPDGSHQVTYRKHPLYGYVGNASPGETSYINALVFGGYWRAMNAKGKILRRPPTA